MHARALLVAALAASAAAAPTAAAPVGDVVKLRAVLLAENDAVKQENPAATGLFTATLSKGARTVTWRLTYRGLGSPITEAHIHRGTPLMDSRTGVLLCPRPRGPICPSGAHGTETLLPWMVTAILAGKSFVNVHTDRFVAGEIAGVVKIVGTS
jgi:hypothetical protein